MAEIDPVVLRLIADDQTYRDRVRSTTRTVEQQLGLQEKRVKSLERQMQQSSGQIGGALKRLAGVFATYFTGRELVGLLDSFTRFQNQLKVAGLEGEALASVQERLRVIGATYGVELEALASTFNRASLAQKELGASTEGIIRLNEIVAASLKVAGTSSQQASGALLQLAQALGSGIVRAEEFNSILEGALPLAQAAARGIDGMGGSVAKLRAEIVAGNVTSREFYEGVLKGGVQTIKDAENATLTLAGGVTVLRNELMLYFGEADRANGVSAALGAALKALADNLDRVIPALAAVAVGLGVGYVTNAVAARVATVALGTAAATTGRALLAAFGGPVGIAITAVAVGLGYVASQSETAENRLARLRGEVEGLEAETERMERRLREAGVGIEGVGDGADTASGQLNSFWGVIGNTISRLQQLARQAGITRAALIGTQIEDARTQLAGLTTASASQRAFGITSRNTGPATAAQRAFGQGPGIDADRAAVAVLESQIRLLERQQRAVLAAGAAGVDLDDPAGATGAPAATGGSGKPKPAPQGPSAEELADRAARTAAQVADEIGQLNVERLRIIADITNSAEDRAAAEEAALKAERASFDRQLALDKELDETQRRDLTAARDAADAQRARAIEIEKAKADEQRAADLAEEQFRAQSDALRLQYDLADTEADRKAIALRILDAEDEYLRAKLRAVVAADSTADEEERRRAQIALDALDAQAGARRASVERQFEGSLARYARDARDADTRIEDAAARRIRDLNETIVDTMTAELGVKDPFLRELLTIFLDQNVFGPIAEALSRNSGGGGLLGSVLSAIGLAAGTVSGGGGSFGNIKASLGGIKARASGGPVSAGQPYLVGERGPELMVPSAPGFVIPNQALASPQAAQPAVVRLIVAEGQMFEPRVEAISGRVSVEVVRLAQPALTDAAVNETFSRAGRPRI